MSYLSPFLFARYCGQCLCLSYCRLQVPWFLIGQIRFDLHLPFGDYVTEYLGLGWSVILLELPSLRASPDLDGSTRSQLRERGQTLRLEENLPALLRMVGINNNCWCTISTEDGSKIMTSHLRPSPSPQNIHCTSNGCFPQLGSW